MPTKQVDIIVLSDIHLGSDMSRAEDLLATLGRYRFNTLILNGDIFDNSNSKRLRNEHWEFLSYLRGLTEAGKEVIWVAGNHDRFAKDFFSLIGAQTCTEYIFEHAGRRYLVIHGNQYDKFLIKNEFMSDTLGSSYRMLQKLGGKKQRVSRMVKRRYKSWLRLSHRVAKGAIQHALSRNINVVICSHTHQYMKTESHGVEYLNTGCWADRPSSFITIDGDGPKIQVFD